MGTGKGKKDAGRGASEKVQRLEGVNANSLMSASGGLQVVSLCTPISSPNKNRHLVTKLEQE